MDYQVPELQVLPGEGTHLNHKPLQHSLGPVTQVSDLPCPQGDQTGLLRFPGEIFDAFSMCLFPFFIPIWLHLPPSHLSPTHRSHWVSRLQRDTRAAPS